MFDPMTEYTGDVAWEPTVDTDSPITLTPEQADVLRLAADEKSGGVRLSGSRRQWRSLQRVYAIRGGTVQALCVAGVVEVVGGRLVVTERGRQWLAAHPVEVAA